VGLFLGCERGPLATHTGLFAAFLAAVRHQLDVGLGPGAPGDARSDGDASDDEGGGGGGGGEGGGGFGPCPLGLPLVEELLPDSFLRRQFGAFLEVLHDAGPRAPAPLAQQARGAAHWGPPWCCCRTERGQLRAAVLLLSRQTRHRPGGVARRNEWRPLSALRLL
jgi:hypothetical protein